MSGANVNRMAQERHGIGREVHRYFAQEEAIRKHLKAGNGILKVAAIVGCGSGTVQRVRREMAEELRKAA